MTRILDDLSMAVLAGVLALVAIPADAAPPVDEEFAVSADDEQLDVELPGVTFRLEAGGSGLLLMDDAMNDDYGGLAAGDLTMILEYDERTQFFFGAGWGRRTVDLGEDDPTFETAETLELEMVPVRFGMRTNSSPLRSFRMNLGLFFEVTHLQETAPYFTFYPALESGRSAESGWATRFGLSLGPEWRLADDRWSLGCEVQMATGGGEVGDERDREVSLTGFGARVFCAWKLGTYTEEEGER